MAFDNKLAIVEMTGGQILAMLENSVSRAEFTDGRFPQLAGVTIEFDDSRTPLEGVDSLTDPSRIRFAIITKADNTEDLLVDNFLAQGDLSRTFVLATNSFLQTGGDGYASIQAGTELAVTEQGEQNILADYIRDDLGGFVSITDPPPNPRVIRL